MRTTNGSWNRVLGGVAGSIATVVGGLGTAGLVIGTVAASTVVSWEARAQGGMARMMSAQMSSSGMAISRRSFDEYSKLLGLTDEQKETAMTLWEGYKEAHKTATDEMQAKMEGLQEKARDTGDWSVFQKDLPDMQKDYAEKVEKAEKSLVEDVKATLTPEQLEKWPAIERHRRRDTSLRFGFYSGTALDLIRIVQRQGINANSDESKEVLQQYEMELDNKLMGLVKWGEDMRADAFKKAGDMNAQMEFIKKAGEYSKEVRDVNRRYMTRLAATLDEESKAKFEEEFNKRAYPRIYKDSHTLEMIKAAEGFSDLNDTQKEAVKTIAEQYKREATAVNATWAKSQDDAEEKAGGSMSLMMAQWMGGSDDVKKAQEELKKKREERKEVDDKFAKRLKEALGKEQTDRLPSKKPTNQDPWDMGFFVEEEGADD
ncbi:MAG: hypothetical protein U0640_11440 [Phycisphaerales bacterium]